jgi:hypothetical protein
MITAQEAVDLRHRSDEDETQAGRIARLLSGLETQIRAHAAFANDLEYTDLLNDEESEAIILALIVAKFNYDVFYGHEIQRDGRREVEFAIHW